MRCRTGSLQAPLTSEQLHTLPVSKKTVDCSQDGSHVATPLRSVVESQSSSSPSGSHSSTSSQESGDILLPKPQPPLALCPSKLANPVKCPRPKLPQFLLVEGEMSVEEDDSTVQDSVSSKSTSSDKSVRPSVEGRCALEVGSDVSSEPLTFHTDFGDGCNAVASSDEERRSLEVLLASRSKLQSKLLDVNENYGKKESVSSHYGVKDPELTLAWQKLTGVLDQQKVITELCNGSQYLPVTSSNVVVNMVLSSVVTQPEDQNSAALESDAADHSHDNSESDMSISDEASAHEAPAISPNITAEEKSQQPEKSSGVNDATSSDHPDDAEAAISDRANDVSKSDEADTSLEHVNDANKTDEVQQVPSADGETRTVHIRPKSPESEKSESHSKSGKRGRSRSSERNQRRSRSRERKRNRSRTSDRSRKQSGIASEIRSPGHSPKRDSRRQKDRKRSRSSSRSRRRRSSSKEHHSRSSRTSSSRSSRNKKRSRSRSHESRRKRSRSRSRDSRRRSRSADQARRKRQSRSRSTDRSYRSRTSRNEDSERKVDRSVRQVDQAIASKNHSSDRSHDSPHRRRKSPPQSERAVTKRDEKASSEKSENSSAEKAVSNQQSDSDLSSAESGRQPKCHEDNVADNNRIAVISFSSSTNRRLPQEEFESDEEPPADLPIAYDPSEPTEDNFRNDGKASEHHREPPHWVPPNQRMPMVDMSRPPPVFPPRLPPPPPLSRFPHRPPHDGVMRDMKPGLMPPNHFGVPLSDGGRPPMNVPPRLPMPPEVQPPLPFSQPMLTTPAGVLPQPPVRLPPGMNVDRVPLIVRGPVEPARLFFVPPGVGQPMRLTEAASLVGLPRLVCPPAQGAMADLVRLPLGQPQPRPGTILSGPPFVSGNQVMIRPAPVLFQQMPERCVESPQSAAQILTNLPVSQIPQMSAAQQPLVSNMSEMPFPLNSGPPMLPNIPGPPGPSGGLSQPQPTQALSSSSASSPSSGSQDAEDMLLERYRAKPEPPQCLFPSQKAPDPPKPAVDAQQKSPDRTSEDSEKSSDHLQPPQPPPVPDPRTSVTTSSEVVVPTSASSESVPSDPRLLLQFLLKQTRQSTAATDGTVPPSDDQSSLVRPSAPQELHAASRNSPEIVESPAEKTSKNRTAYSPSQADWQGEEEDEEEGNQQSESVREMKVCSCILLN